MHNILNLLDIHILLRKGTTYLLMSVLVALPFAGVIVLIHRVLAGGSLPLWIYFLLLLLLAIALQPRLRGVQRMVDRWFYRSRYDYLQSLERFTRETQSITDLSGLAAALTKAVALAMQAQNAYLMLPSPQTNDFVLRSSASDDNPGPCSLSSNSALLAWMRRNDGYLRAKDLDILPELKGLRADERKTLQQLGSEIYMPLKTRAALTGILVLTPKLSQEPYSSEDIAVLWTLARQAAMTIENARLYQEARDSYEELKSAQEYLVQSEKLRALGQMASGVAHDFNNLLAAILGRAQLALELTKDDEVRDNLSIIEEAALGGAATVRRLQTFTRVRTDQDFSPVDLNEVVEGLLRIVEAQRAERQEIAGVQIDVITHLGEVPAVQGNAGDLRDTLTNIVLNAMDAMPQGGELTISTSREDSLAVVSISDTGVGIPEKVKRHIFDPFYTTKGIQGSGLGLSVAYGVITRHGGRINVKSQVDKGATFRIELPLSDQVAPVKNSVALPPQAESTNVLLVDDDRQVGEVLKLMLTQEGHKVTIATSGREALAAFRRQQYGLVITDLGMPDISGRDIAREISRLKPKTPIILITGWGVQLDPREMAELGIKRIIPKPFSKQEFLSEIAPVLNRTD